MISIVNPLAIVHPLADELLGLVEHEPHVVPGPKPKPEVDTSWRWMALVGAAIGLLAVLTR